MNLAPIHEAMSASVPHGDIWAVIRGFSHENTGKREGWTVDQWERFCAAFERCKGDRAQTLAFALKENYFIAKDFLAAGRGNEINRFLFERARAMEAKDQANAERSAALPPPLARGPRRKPVGEYGE